MESFGKQADVEAVRAFREKAVADGWMSAPTYPGHEGEDRAATLKRDGFTVMTLSRDPQETPHRLKCCAGISAWGPDGLAVAVNGTDYPGFDYFQSGVETCGVCGKRAGQTFRFSFAGRACRECLPKAKAESEKPGWDN